MALESGCKLRIDPVIDFQFSKATGLPIVRKQECVCCLPWMSHEKCLLFRWKTLYERLEEASKYLDDLVSNRVQAYIKFYSGKYGCSTEWQGNGSDSMH